MTLKKAAEDVFRTASALIIMGGSFYGMTRMGLFGETVLRHPMGDPYIKTNIRREIFYNSYECETKNGIIHKGTSVRPVRTF